MDGVFDASLEETFAASGTLDDAGCTASI